MSPPTADPRIALRREHDDWGVLFDPDTGKGFGVDPVGMFIWEKLDGQHTPATIAEALRTAFDKVPEEAAAHVEAFIGQLRQKGLVVDRGSPSCD